MKRRSAVAAAGVAALAIAALAIGPGPARAGSSVSAGDCNVGQIEIWLGDGSGGGTAGTIYYPLEFSNIGQSTCTLIGIPKVLAVNSDYKQIGGASRSLKIGSEGDVTLTSGETAHAILGIEDAGAVCGKGVSAAGLKVYIPDRSSGTVVSPFPFAACRTRTTLVAEPIHRGVGIPGYTSS